ncbi:MAG: hypothetical protein O9340_14240 [Cyclobacteriaceae bacterium]|nr:hypothetical protein [Cyclobacteriaceae bacterium]
MRLLTYCSIFILFVLGCTEEDYEAATVTFYPSLAGSTTEPAPGTAGTPFRVDLVTSRVLARESQVNIKVAGNGAGYGFSYVTNPPQLQQGIITLTIPAGETTTFFTITPLNDGVVEVNDYEYTFTIDQFSNSIRSTGQNTFKFYVAEPPLVDQNFNDCSGAPAAFTENIVPGSMAATLWACTDFGYPDESTKAVEANAFGKGAGVANSYLILNEPLDGADFNEMVFSMQVYSRFSGAGQLKLKYSTTYSGAGNPEADGVIWTDVPNFSEQLPSAGSRAWVLVKASVKDVPDQPVYVAFQFQGGTTGSSSNWRIDDFNIKIK